jgi:outer membrane protein TolC
VRRAAVVAALLGAAVPGAGVPGAARAEGTGELTFEAAIRLALEHDERAQIDVQTYAAARARVDEARAFFIPSLTLTGSYIRRSGERTQMLGPDLITLQAENALAAQANLTMTLFDARSIPLYRQATLERDAARRSTANDLRLLGFDAANGYLVTLGAQQVVEAAQRRLDLARRELGDARARFQAQLVRSNDVTKAELEEANAEQALTQAQGDLANAYLNLGFLVGAEVGGPLREPSGLLDDAARPPPDAAALAGEGRSRRLDISAQRLHARAQHELAREPLLRYLPSLGLNAQVRTTNEAGFAPNPDWFVGVILTWKLWDGGEALGENAEKNALAAIADLTAQSTWRHVEIDVRQSLVALGNAQAGGRQAAAALAAAKKNATETQALYKQGLASALDLADAEARLFDAEVAAIRARYALALAYLGLRAAVGLDALGKEPAG